MPERLGDNEFDPHEAAGISEVLPSPEGLYNPAAEMLQAEMAALETKIGKGVESEWRNMWIAVAAALTVLGRAAGPEVMQHLGNLASSSSIDWSLDIFRELGVDPLSSAMIGSALTVLDFAEVKRMESKLLKVTEKLRRAKAKTSFSHGAE